MLEANLPFYKKLNLDLDATDWRFLNYLSHTYLNHAEELRSPNYIDTNKQYYKNPIPEFFGSYRHYFLKNSTVDYSDNSIFKRIANLFKPGTELNSLENIYQRSQISCVREKLFPHRDKRKCVITIPVITLTTPVFWYKTTSPEFDKEMILMESDTYVEIESYDYCHPVTLLNTEKFHGTPDNLTKRIFFQVGLAESFEEVVNSLV